MPRKKTPLMNIELTPKNIKHIQSILIKTLKNKYIHGKDVTLYEICEIPGKELQTWYKKNLANYQTKESKPNPIHCISTTSVPAVAQPWLLAAKNKGINPSTSEGSAPSISTTTTQETWNQNIGLFKQLSAPTSQFPQANNQINNNNNNYISPIYIRSDDEDNSQINNNFPIFSELPVEFNLNHKEVEQLLNSPIDSLQLEKNEPPLENNNNNVTNNYRFK